MIFWYFFKRRKEFTNAGIMHGNTKSVSTSEQLSESIVLLVGIKLSWSRAGV